MHCIEFERKTGSARLFYKQVKLYSERLADWNDAVYDKD